MNNSEIKGVTQPKTKLGKSKMDKILKAARKLFSKNGFYQTSITDICREQYCRRHVLYLLRRQNSPLPLPDGGRTARNQGYNKRSAA